jgi:hypothetical protein
MAGRETILSAKIRAAVNALPYARLFRNSVGQDKSTFVRYGLAVGSADLIGIVITNTGIGKFLSVEVKTPTGRIEPLQIAWRDLIIKLGGCAGIVRSVKEALDLVESGR